MKNNRKFKVFSRRSMQLLFALILSLVFITTAKAVVVDIMIVYDTTATAWVVENGGMAAFSEEAVSRMNQALQNSGITSHSFRVVHSMPVDYTTGSDGSTSLSPDLYPLQEGSGVFAGVHAARDSHGADLVAMMVDTGRPYGYVGVGYLLSWWSGSPSSGFTVNAIQSVNISHTLTHEVGHNLGAHHAKLQTASPGPNTNLDADYSAGWYFTGTNSVKYHTIMAYSADGYGNSYSSAPLFSTPLKNHQGTPAGDASDGDNSRLIGDTISIVSGYRDGMATYTLTVRSSGVTAVAIAGSPLIYGGTSNYSRNGINQGTGMSLIAPSTSSGAAFSYWSGCSSASGNICTVSMTSDTTVSANYTPPGVPRMMFLNLLLGD